MTLRYYNIDQALPYLMSRALNHGTKQPSRNGFTMECTFQHIVLNHPWEREITLPSRKASLPAQIAETMWVLGGRDDIDWLGHYLPRAAEFSDDGETWHGAYGRRLRDWYGVDQLAHVVRMLKEDPTTRRAAMVIYDPTRDTDYDGKDVPCNNWLHFLARDGQLHLHVAVRSNDLMWGWSGINAFEWSALLEVVAGLTDLEMGELHFSVSSLHLYDRHLEKAGRIAQDSVQVGELKPAPRFGKIRWEDLDHYIERWFEIEEMIRSGDFDSDLIDLFPEPLFRSWLHVIAWWWTGDEEYLKPIEGRLAVAARLSPGRPEKSTPDTSFIDFVINLHTEKSAVYGDSWKRRGEMLGIMANIARKIDRLGVAGAGDTAADTAVDLFVYLAKYRHWLQSDHSCGLLDHENRVIRAFYHSRGANPPADEVLIIELKTMFEDLWSNGLNKDYYADDVEAMARKAAQLAESLWLKEQS